MCFIWTKTSTNLAFVVNWDFQQSSFLESKYEPALLEKSPGELYIQSSRKTAFPICLLHNLFSSDTKKLNNINHIQIHATYAAVTFSGANSAVCEQTVRNYRPSIRRTFEYCIQINSEDSSWGPVRVTNNLSVISSLCTALSSECDIWSVRWIDWDCRLYVCVSQTAIVIFQNKNK